MLLPILAAITMTQAKTVTFDEPAGTADHVIADLGKAAGIKLATTPETEKEVLLIRVKNANLRTLLLKIAKVTAAQWDDKDGVLTLIPDQGAREAQRQAEINAKAEAIRNVFAKFKEDIASTNDGQKQGEAQMMLSEMGVGGIDTQSLAGRYVMQLDPNALAQLGPQDRIVFASNPNSMQFQLPPIDQSKIETFIKEHNDRAEAVAKAEQDQEQNGGITAEARKMMTLMGIDPFPHPISGFPAKIVLSVEKGSRFQMFGDEGETATLRFYDQNGKVTLSEQSGIPTDTTFLKRMQAMTQEATGKPGKPEPSKSGKKIEYSKLTQEFQQLSGSGLMAKGRAPELSAGLKERLLHPETFDPLSFTASEALKAVAAEKQEQLVADLPDTLAPTLFDSESGDTTSAYMDTVKAFLKTEEQDGWLQIASSTPTKTRFLRLDRRALATLIQNAQRKGYASLDDLAVYAVDNEDSNLIANAATPYVMLFVPGTFANFQIGDMDWQALQLYGSMGVDQRDALKKGNEIPVSGLTPFQRDLVMQMVFGAGADLEEVKPAEPPSGLPSFFTKMISRRSHEIKDYLQEPTEALPQGLPHSAVIACQFTTQSIVNPDDKETMASLIGPMGSDIYGMLQFMAQQAPPQAAAMMPKFKNFRVGTRGLYDIHIKVLPTVYVHKELVDDLIPPDAPVVTAANLPSDFLSRSNATVEALKNSPFAALMKMGMPGMQPGAP